MIQDKATARELSALMLELSAKLNGSVALVRDKCSPGELVGYRRAVGEILGALWDQAMEPLYRVHPDIEPEGLRGSSPLA